MFRLAQSDGATTHVPQSLSCNMGVITDACLLISKLKTFRNILRTVDLSFISARMTERSGLLGKVAMIVKSELLKDIIFLICLHAAKHLQNSTPTLTKQRWRIR